MKLKILGLALLALAATSAFAVTNASGTLGGHFVHEGPGANAKIVAHESKLTEHKLQFFLLNAGAHTTNANFKAIECEKSTYEGTVTAKTVTSITMAPTYTNCATTGEATGSVHVHVNGCTYTFTSAAGANHGTVDILCPAGKAIEITHTPQGCTIKVPAQTALSGIKYDTVVENNKHSLTATVTVNTITGHFEAGLCVFLGTNQKFEMVGSVTITGLDHATGAQIPITQT